MISANSIKNIKSLQQKKFRNQYGVFVAEGSKLVNDILKSSLEVESIYHTPEWASNDILGAVKVENINPREMERISGLTTPSPVLAIVKIPENRISVSPSNGTITLALDEVQDPGNLGTIIRIADWFGISNIICSKGTADAYAPKVVQATMGAIARVKLFYTDLPDYIDKAKSNNIPVFGTFLSGDNIYSANLPTNGIVVMGNEGKGISDEVEKMISQRLTIPNFGLSGDSSESLNVAMATAIVCSEFKRRTI
jgi:TrmH family RNA methyltransferase